MQVVVALHRQVEAHDEEQGMHDEASSPMETGVWEQGAGIGIQGRKKVVLNCD